MSFKAQKNSILIALSAVFYQFLASDLHATTKWIKTGPIERRCSLICGHSGLEDIQSDKFSVCATHMITSGIIQVGEHLSSQNYFCDIDASKKDPQKIHENYCLCTEDGTPEIGDYAWLKNLSPGRCDTTCKKQFPKFGYAVYADYQTQGWNHVCSDKKGRIGTTGGGKTTCVTPNGESEDFLCLCTQSFAGDLDPRFDP